MIRISRGRTATLAVNIAGSGLARIANIFITLALVPLTINNLSTEHYALFAAAVSFSIMVTYSDLGLGLSIVNTVAEDTTPAGRKSTHEAISTIWYTLVLISSIGLAIIGLTLLLNYSHAPNETINSIRNDALLIAGSCVLFGIPSGIIQRILFAEQKNLQANLWTTSGRLLAFCLVFIEVKFGKPDLNTLIFLALFTPTLVNWACLVYHFKVRRHRLSPRFTYFNPKQIPKRVRGGLSLLGLSMIPYFETGVDVLLIATIGDILITPSYDLYSKLLIYIPAFASIAALPVWPAVARAKADGETNWIKVLEARIYLLVGGVAIFGAISIAIFGPFITELWTGTRVSLDNSLAFGMAIVAVATTLGTIQSSFLAGKGLISLQAKIATIYIPTILFSKALILMTTNLSIMVWVCAAAIFIRLYVTRRLASNH